MSKLTTFEEFNVNESYPGVEEIKMAEGTIVANKITKQLIASNEESGMELCIAKQKGDVFISVEDENGHREHIYLSVDSFKKIVTKAKEIGIIY